MEPPQTLYRFERVDASVQPAFLSREQLPEAKRGMLRYFYRERPPVR